MKRYRFWRLALLLIGFGLAPRAGIAQEGLPPIGDPVVTHPGAPIAGALPGSGLACSGPGCGACDSCGPTRDWTIRVDVGVVYMRRDRPNNSVIFNDPLGVPLLTEDDFDFGWEPGIDARVVADRCDGLGIEARYLGINDFQQSRTFPVPIGSTIATTPPTLVGEATVPTFTYRNQLHSAELNLRRVGERATLVAGFRYLNLEEDLSAVSQFAIANSLANMNTNNNLWGLQIGGDARLFCRSRFRVDGILRAGLYLNDMDATFTRNFNPPVFGPAAAGDGTTQMAFVGELGVHGTFDVTRNISLKAGYQMLYLSGVALAGEQVSGLDNAVFPTNLGINRGDVFYHGARVGIEFRW